MQLLNARSPDIDAIGRQLAYFGQLGRSLPPSWDGVRHSIPVTGPQGEWLGRMLPGRGFYSEYDLRSVGIRRSIPHVFERSRILKLADWFRSERAAVRLAAWRDAAMRWGHIAPDFARMTITAYDGIISARASGLGNDIVVAKGSLTSTVSASWNSLMNLAGSPSALATLAGGSSTVGAGGTACTNATTGAWSSGLTNPLTGHRKYLLTLGYTSVNQLQMALLFDLLVGVSGISGTATSSNINTVALPRYGASGSTNNANGAGVWPTLEVTTALGSTSVTVAGTYTDQSGSAGTFASAQSSTASAPAGRLQPVTLAPFFQLEAGDYGVQSVQTITLSASTGAGAMSLYLVFPLTFLPGVAGSLYLERDSTIQIDGLTELVNASQTLGCLGAFVMTSTTSTGANTWFLRTCEG